MKLFCFVVLLALSADAAYVGDVCSHEGQSGVCMDIRKCPSALDGIKKKQKPTICGFEKSDVNVCCVSSTSSTTTPIPELTTVVRSETTATPAQEPPVHDSVVGGERPSEGCEPLHTKHAPKIRNKAWDKCIQYRERLLLQCKYQNSTGRWEYKDLCQVPGESLVIGGGGTSADRNDFRHMALLLYGDATSLDLFCGGSVLSERYILTAAHCSSSIQRGPVTTAVTGILKLSDPEKLWRRNKIQSVIVHPEFNSPHKYHDIALLKTLDEIQLDEIVVPICLHTGSEDVDDRFVFATGWGALGHRQPFADNLQTIPLRINDNCSKVYGPQRLLMRGFDNETQVCYGDDGQIRDTCQGDSGGPVQVSIGRCLYSVVAVTSFGKQCATAGVPAVYTRVQHYWRWAADIVWPDHTL